MIPRWRAMAGAVALAMSFLAVFEVSAADGKAVYAQTCAACHASGIADAPKLGDKQAWAPRLKFGQQTMIASVLKGKGAMPPKGGNASLSDADVKAALEYMLSQAK